MITRKCNCQEQILTEVTTKKSNGLKCEFAEINLLDGRTFSTVTWLENKGTRKFMRKTAVFHSHCPWCGIELDKLRLEDKP